MLPEVPEYTLRDACVHEHMCTHMPVCVCVCMRRPRPPCRRFSWWAGAHPRQLRGIALEAHALQLDSPWPLAGDCTLLPGIQSLQPGLNLPLPHHPPLPCPNSLCSLHSGLRGLTLPALSILFPAPLAIHLQAPRPTFGECVLSNPHTVAQGSCPRSVSVWQMGTLRFREAE